MSIELVAILVALTFMGGVALTLNFMGKRPINVNVNAHAEAHGGSAHAGAVPARATPAPVGGSFMGILKALAIVGVVIFILIMAGGIMSKIGEPAKVVVNVPAQVPQEMPNITVAPPVVNVPKAEPPTINVAPQAPVVVAPSLLETIGLIIGAVASVIVIVVSYMILKMFKTQNHPTTVAPPIEYERTSYGWTPKAIDASPINAEEIVPGLFTQKHE